MKKEDEGFKKDELRIKKPKNSSEKTSQSIHVQRRTFRHLRLELKSGQSSLQSTKNRRADGKKVKNFSRGMIARISKGSHVQAANSYSRRVIVKSLIVSKASLKTNKSMARVIEDHLVYLQREGVGKNGKVPDLFSNHNRIIEPKVFAERLADDRHHFRIILSPENGQDLNLKLYAQEVVKQMEVDLETSLEWVGVEHHNTDNPHVHLLIRGKDDLGNDLIIRPNYISHGLRARAQEIATLELGPRSEREIALSVNRMLKQDRVIQLDKIIASSTELNQVSIAHLSGKATYEEQRMIVKRLEYLKTIGLAQSIDSKKGLYKVKENFVEILKDLEAQNDIYKRISRFGLMEVKQFDSNNGLLVGKVLDKGLSDELKNKYYLMLDGADGNKWYIDLKENDIGKDLESGDWIKLEGDKVSILAKHSIAKDMEELKPTWADKMLLFPKSKGLVSPVGVGFELNSALEQRKAYHMKNNMAFMKGSRFCIKKGLLNTLEAKEIDFKKGELFSKEGFTFVPVNDRNHIQGKLIKVCELSSGTYGVVKEKKDHIFIKLKTSQIDLMKADGGYFRLSLKKRETELLPPIVQSIHPIKEIGLDI